MSNKRSILVLLFCFVFVGSSVLPTFAGTESLPSNVNGEEIVDEIIDEIIEEGDFTRKEEKEIIEDVEALDEVGIPVESIDNVEIKNGDATYSIEYSNGITDDVTIDELNNDDIIISIVEDEKCDELCFSSDGAIILDGNLVTFETSSIIENAYDYNCDFATSSGGYKWYTTAGAPSKMKSAKYGSYSNNWVCSSVSLQKSIGCITYSAFISILSGSSCGAVKLAKGVAIGFSSSAYFELINYNKKSKNFSYKTFVARAKSNSRYLVERTWTYAEKGFKGKYTTTFAYGLLI